MLFANFWNTCMFLGSGTEITWHIFFISVSGIKSTTGNYRDNRFNRLFQNAAQILKHCQDFLEVIDTVQAPNNKLKAVEEDLKSDTVKILLVCLGLIYVKIIRPYWELINSGRVAYLELYMYSLIQKLQFLERLCTTSRYTCRKWHMD